MNSKLHLFYHYYYHTILSGTYNCWHLWRKNTTVLRVFKFYVFGSIYLLNLKDMNKKIAEMSIFSWIFLFKDGRFIINIFLNVYISKIVEMKKKKLILWKNFLHLMFGISFSLKLYGLDSFFRSLSLILSDRFRGFPIYLRKVASR